ncbi:hypothetical protein GCM10027047_08670 [Rhodococcus aerolatus]
MNDARSRLVPVVVATVAALVLALAALVVPTAAATTAAAAVATPPPSVDVRDGRLVDAAGTPLVLRGVNRSGTEYACAQGWGLSDGPLTPASVAAMRTWAVDAVRVPLNEACWLGLPSVDPALGGRAYQDAVRAYVGVLHDAGMVAVLDLHWSAPGDEPALGQQPMADADHSPAFWTSVATTFRDDPAVLLDLVNEPHGISWACWRDGCDTPGYRTAGMQSLVDAVRATGARQPLLLAPLGHASAVGGPEEGGSDPAQGWLAWRPVDPLDRLVLSWHVYDFSGCSTRSCWDATVAPVAAQVPVVLGEVGETDCATGFVTALLDWSTAHGISTFGWAWNATGDPCGAGGPSLVRDYDGTPTVWGAAVRDHYRALAAGTPAQAPTLDPVPATAVGVPTLLRARVPAGPAVSFSDGAAPLPGCTDRPVRAGAATCVATFRTAGPRTVGVTAAGGTGGGPVDVAATPTLLQLLTGLLVGLGHALGLV